MIYIFRLRYIYLSSQANIVIGWCKEKIMFFILVIQCQLNEFGALGKTWDMFKHIVS